VLFGTVLGQLGSLSSFTGSPAVTNVGNTGVALEAVAFGNGSSGPGLPGTPAPTTLLLIFIGLAAIAGWYFLGQNRAVRPS
jgi:hypothetical protein